MDIIHSEISKYAEAHTTDESDILRQINRDTHAHVLMPRMLSGHLQGSVLSMISHMIKPKVVLEIGTYSGYSAICLAYGLASTGKLITLDINDVLELTVRDYVKSAGLVSQIDYRIGNALQIIPTLQESFDLVFIDADKENYSQYYDLVINHVPLGGYILADNVLWSGKVLDEKPDKDTRAIIEFNRKVHTDKRVENVLLPIRDGIMVMRKVQE
jgi:predicted O-methyltransferase YrrM